MKRLLIQLGFTIWSLRHGGCKHFINARKSLLRALMYRGVMLLRNALINLENCNE